VAGEAGLHPDVARDVQNSTADVVLIGVADEPARAMEACRSITSLTSARCLVLGDPETERTATSGSPESGANALLAKGTPLIELIELVESVVLEQSSADGPGPNKYRGT